MIRPLLLASLLALHVIAHCVSLVYVGTIYTQIPIIPTFSPAHAAEAVLISGAFGLTGAALFERARFSFGYWIGFYFFTIALGYLWFVAFSHFAYDHLIAAASAFASAIAFLVPALFLNVPLETRFTAAPNAITWLLHAIIAIGVATIAIGSLYNFTFVGFSEISDFRYRANFPTPLRYTIGITSTALLPFAFACFLERRQFWAAGACLILSLGFYPLTLTKLALFAPPWLIFLALLTRYLEPRMATILSLLLPGGAGLISLMTSNDSIFRLVNFRMLALPSFSLDVYNDYFAHHQLTRFCQVSVLKPFMSCAYSDELGSIMNGAYQLGNLNASMFATEGVASVGLAGAPLSALVCGFLVSVANSLSRHLPPRLVILSSGVLVQALMNVPFTTAMLTHGALVLFLLWSVTPKNALSASDVAKPVSVGT